VNRNWSSDKLTAHWTLTDAELQLLPDRVDYNWLGFAAYLKFFELEAFGQKFRRCLTGVDSISKGLPEFVSIDEESKHEIVHALRLGEAQRAADEPFNPRPQI